MMQASTYKKTVVKSIKSPTQIFILLLPSDIMTPVVPPSNNPTCVPQLPEGNWSAIIHSYVVASHAGRECCAVCLIQVSLWPQ